MTKEDEAGERRAVVLSARHHLKAALKDMKRAQKMGVRLRLVIDDKAPAGGVKRFEMYYELKKFDIEAHFSEEL